MPDPLFNAIVYVPNGAVDAFTPGVSCDKCGTPVSGKPIAVALTDATGKFTLENVPVGTQIPLVVQIGRWRRQVTIPEVAPCAETKLPAELTRLPRNRTEGDMPLIAVATGSSDPFECALRKLGIDDSEFTPPTGPGRVHLYKENGADMATPLPPATTLYEDATRLRKLRPRHLRVRRGRGQKVDEGDAEHRRLHGRGRARVRDALRIRSGSPMPPIRSPRRPSSSPATRRSTTLATGVIDTSFPKGQAFADWMANVGGSPAGMKGQMSIVEPRHDVDAVSMDAQRWISTNAPQASVQHLTYNTPVGASAAAQCGKVLFSDFHVGANAVDEDKDLFPDRCLDTPLSPQEKAIEFMLFDLSSCVQKETEPPKPPPTSVR